MKRDIKFRWVEALRSGRYQQGRIRLHFREGGKDRFCCLGVLCDLAVQDKVIDEPSFSRHSHAFEYGPDKELALLPHQVIEWAGLSDQCPSVMGADFSNQCPTIMGNTLTVLNDDGTSFEDIALLIEKYIPEED